MSQFIDDNPANYDPNARGAYPDMEQVLSNSLDLQLIIYVGSMAFSALISAYILWKISLMIVRVFKGK